MWWLHRFARWIQRWEFMHICKGGWVKSRNCYSVLMVATIISTNRLHAAVVQIVLGPLLSISGSFFSVSLRACNRSSALLSKWLLSYFLIILLHLLFTLHTVYLFNSATWMFGLGWACLLVQQSGGFSFSWRTNPNLWGSFISLSLSEYYKKKKRECCHEKPLFLNV